MQSHLTSSFADDGNASWYWVCRVPMVEWLLDCENCRHLTIVGLHDTGPWTHLPQVTQLCDLCCVEETPAELVYCDSFLTVTVVTVPLRTGIWPDHTPVARRLYGSLGDLRCTATFNRETGVSIWRTRRRGTKTTEFAVTSYIVDGPEWVNKDVVRTLSDDLGPVWWRPTIVKWRQFSQSNSHSTIGTWQTEYHEALPSSRTTRWGVTARSPTMVTLHDTGFVECRWWNGGWTVKTFVTWLSSASIIPAPGVSVLW